MYSFTKLLPVTRFSGSPVGFHCCETLVFQTSLWPTLVKFPGSGCDLWPHPLFPEIVTQLQLAAGFPEINYPWVLGSHLNLTIVLTLLVVMSGVSVLMAEKLLTGDNICPSHEFTCAFTHTFSHEFTCEFINLQQYFIVKHNSLFKYGLFLKKSVVYFIF